MATLNTMKCFLALALLPMPLLAAGFDDEYEEKTWSEIEV